MVLHRDIKYSPAQVYLESLNLLFTILKDFEDLLIQLWGFFKNLPKKVNIYAKTSFKIDDLGEKGC